MFKKHVHTQSGHRTLLGWCRRNTHCMHNNYIMHSTTMQFSRGIQFLWLPERSEKRLLLNAQVTLPILNYTKTCTIVILISSSNEISSPQNRLGTTHNIITVLEQVRTCWWSGSDVSAAESLSGLLQQLPHLLTQPMHTDNGTASQTPLLIILIRQVLTPPQLACTQLNLNEQTQDQI